jgi:hypothetical protein
MERQGAIRGQSNQAGRWNRDTPDTLTKRVAREAARAGTLAGVFTTD